MNTILIGWSLPAPIMFLVVILYYIKLRRSGKFRPTFYTTDYIVLIVALTPSFVASAKFINDWENQQEQFLPSHDIFSLVLLAENLWIVPILAMAIAKMKSHGTAPLARMRSACRLMTASLLVYILSYAYFLLLIVLSI